MSIRSQSIAILVLTAVALVLSVACERYRKAPPLTDEEVEELTDGQPQIFVRQHGTLTLEGIENLYLGQEQDEAMEALDEYCETIKVFDGGWRHSDAVFKGCNVYAGDDSMTLRAGFWPFNDDRVSTLEIQSRPIPQSVVRARFVQIADELSEDLPRRGLLRMASTRYRLIASWDDGADEPPHIIIGFHPP